MTIHRAAMSIVTINATEFKAKCLDILDKLADRRLERVEVTKRGRVVAVLTPPAPDPAAVEQLYGLMRGSVVVPPGVDLTAPASDEPWDAAPGGVASVSGAPSPHAVLLDTCAAIWLLNRDRMDAAAIDAILAAGRADGIFVSPVSAWEIGMLGYPGPGRAAALQFLPDPATWFARLMKGAGICAAPFTPEIAIAASRLPGDCHRDPGDRLLIATALHLSIPIVTRDARIADYAAQGHVGLIGC
jgi:PIN domain nuclease of toxin-antitoxin system/antitoxin (DNA-binding transcriptional repressor) of toxin-antitoxin stability system